MSNAFDPEFARWMRRLRYTPMRDVVRGRWTGRLNVNARIDRAAIPDDAKKLVARVVKRTRLWPLEKIDVADDLIAHFADAIASGTDIDAAIRAFGDEPIAAKMIRRAKRRNRPLAWHVFSWMSRATAVLLITYTWLAVRLFIGEPSPRTQYLDEISRKTTSVPLEQRGWPLYRQAIDGIVNNASIAHGKEPLLDERPGSAKWPLAVQCIEDHRAQIELIRRGAARTVAGFTLVPRASRKPTASLWMGRTYLEAVFDANHNDIPLTELSMIGTAGELGIFDDLLRFDSRVATFKRDENRLQADLHAMDGIANQNRVELSSYFIAPKSIDALDEALWTAPEMFSDATLRNLAHELSRATSAADLVSFQSDRIVARDVAQRAFTDDGNGDGRITSGAYPQLIYVWRDSPIDYVRRVAPMPIALRIAPSRREFVDTYDAILTCAEALLHAPMRDADWNAVERSINELSARLDAFPNVMIRLPQLRERHAAAERYLAHRDGVVTAIALELFRRQRGGAYPASLDELVPKYLPAVPADRITGEPIHYKLIDGRPRVYSVGVDRDDDGGRVPDSLDRVARWPLKPRSNLSSTMNGDWILYPQSPDVYDAETK